MRRAENKHGRKNIFVLTPWRRRWELGLGAGLADDYYFINKLTDRGFNVHYVGPRDTAPNDIDDPHYFVHSFPDFFGRTLRWPTVAKRVLWPFLYTLTVTYRAFLVGRRIKPAFILGQTHLSSLPVFLVGRLLNVQTGVKLFGVTDLDRTDWPRPKYLCKNFEQIVAFKVPQGAWIILDDGTNGRDAALRHGVSEDQIHFLPNGVNLEWTHRRPDPLWFRERFDVGLDTDVVLYLSRLVDWKRPDALIRAAPEVLRRTRRSVTFVIVGEGPERANCGALAEELGVASHFRIVGSIPHERVPDAMAAAAVFVATNRRSNMAIPTCEALVCGLPVVAFDTGGTSRVVIDGENGRLVPDGSVEALAAAIGELLDDEEKRRYMRTRAAEMAETSFTGWNERTDMEMAIIDRCLSR